MAATAGWCSAMVGRGAWVVAAASAAPAVPAPPAGLVVRVGPAAWVGLAGCCSATVGPAVWVVMAAPVVWPGRAGPVALMGSSWAIPARPAVLGSMALVGRVATAGRALWAPTPRRAGW